MKAKQTAQQGDVLLKQIESIPSGAVKIATDKLVLAEGETTGHAHRLVQTGAEMFQLENRMFIKLIEPATLKHEEHKEITLASGVWEVGRVREFDYLSMIARTVQD